jgi:hypothetical protein
VRSEIIQIEVCNNYDGFSHLLASYFHENSFHYFKDYLTMKPTWVKYIGKRQGHKPLGAYLVGKNYVNLNVLI